MKQEEKELLLKDLCARLPYGVKFRYKYIDNFFHESYGNSTLEGVIPPYRIIHSTLTGDEYLQIEKDEVKPYLFPLSSMTAEQKEELSDMLFNLEMEHLQDNETGFTIKEAKVAQSEIDWYNKNNFDYRGLIPMGLANDATGLNIY